MFLLMITELMITDPCSIPKKVNVEIKD